MNEEIKNLVRSIGNDAELGRRVRALYNLLHGNGQNPLPTQQEGKNPNNERQILNG